MDQRDRPVSWATARRWGPVVLVAVLSQSGVGASQPWSGSATMHALASLSLALPLALLARAPVLACALVAGAAALQVPLGDSLGFGAFVAVLLAAYGVARGVWARVPAVVGLTLLMAGAVTAGSMEQAAVGPEVVIPLVYLSGAFGVGRLVRHLAAQGDRLRALNAALERERTQQARLAVATERLRIARELHDVVAHRIMLMVIQAEAAVETLDASPDATRDSMLRIQEVGRQGLDDLRSMVRVLRSDSVDLAPPGFADLPALTTVLREAGLDVSLERHGDLASVPAGLQEAGFRIVQEALTNVLKHSAGTRAEVSVRLDDAVLVVDVRDPGPAKPHHDLTGGEGLRGMAERLLPYDGTVEAGPDADGFRVLACARATPSPVPSGAAS